MGNKTLVMDGNRRIWTVDGADMGTILDALQNMQNEIDLLVTADTELGNKVQALEGKVAQLESDNTALALRVSNLENA